jgi:antitoxin ParD1/3/4
MILLTVEGTYNNGKVELAETPEGVEGTRVLVTFLQPVQSIKPNLLAEAFSPAAEALLRQQLNPMNDDEFEAAADLLAEEWAAGVKSDILALSDYAVSRAGIYEDHP